MRKSYCDQCGEFMYEGYPGGDLLYFGHLFAEGVTKTPFEFCSKECKAKFALPRLAEAEVPA